MQNHLPRVLLTGMTGNPGGKESFMLSAFAALKTDYEVWFLADRPHLAHEDDLRRMGAKIARVRHRGKSPIGYYRDIRTLFRTVDFDAVWSHQTVLNTIAPLVISRRHGVRTRIIHSHSTQNLGSWVAGALHPLNKIRVLRVATERIGCSEAAGRWFYGDHEFQVMPNAFDGSQFSFDPQIRRRTRDDLDVRDSGLVLAHIARFGDEKNHQFVVSIVRELSDRGVDVVCALIGDGELRPMIEQQVEDLGISTRFRFLGLRNDVSDLLQAADVSILPSKFEGLPYAILESQAAGLPCVVSDRVPKEVDLTGRVTHVPLEAGVQEWCDAIVKASEAYERFEGARPLEGSPYDIDVARSRIIACVSGNPL